MDLLEVLLLGRLELLVAAEASGCGLRFSSIQVPPLLPLPGAASGTSGASALLVLLSRSRSALRRACSAASLSASSLRNRSASAPRRPIGSPLPPASRRINDAAF